LCFLVQVNYVEDFNESKGKGSFPALITPGYQTAKNANMLASNVSWLKPLCHFLHQKKAIVYYINEIFGNDMYYGVSVC
jgi:hypothetical protein